MTENTSTSGSARDFLAERYGRRARDITPLQGGDWSQAFAFTLDGHEVIARFGRYLDDYLKDQIMVRYASEHLPVPKVIEIGEAHDRFFAVSERAHGRYLETLTGSDLRRVLPSLFHTLDAVRAIDISHTEGYGIWTPDRRGPERTWGEALLRVGSDLPGDRTHGWRKALEASPTGTEPFHRGFDALQELVEHVPEQRHIIHSDLLYRNVLVADDKLAAVFDWGNSQFGDHLYDAAWLIYCQPRWTNWSGLDIRSELERHWEKTGQLADDLEERLRCYQLHIGLAAQAYNAFTGRFGELAAETEQTLALI
jgi:hygromycin-B 4-O-kinase